ncbi:LysE family transporter [Nonomuraea sp. NPDC049649]|uniref:LysE family translocator n=1 Tax=Nonomuraea sp. NPDC049649 TaxID=3155776 RepID=UPI00343A7CE4
MSSLAPLVAFGGVVMLGAMSPGPDFAVVVRRSAVSGRGQGMAAALGIAAGVFGWVVAAATGVAALLAASAVAFTVVKVAGAAYLGYLGYLGVRALLAAVRGGGPPRLSLEGAPQGVWAAFSEGLLTNILNPKAALFFVALVPQFLAHGAGALGLSLVALGGTVLWFVVVANVVSALRAVFARSAVRRTLDAFMGTALIALGINLATATRP